MRRSLLLTSLAASVVVAGCIVAEQRPTAPHDHGSASAPVGSVYNDPTSVDTGGGRLPDLIVQSSATQNSWRVKDEYISNNFCSAIEGGVSEGNRRLLRFTVTTPNIGNADVFVGDPKKHMDPNGDGNTADADGMFEFSTCHDHYHFQNYATYRLIDATGAEWRSAKRGFCMLDTDPYNNGTQTQVGTPNYMNCGTQSRSGFQGVSHGWADTYVWQLAGQYFVLDGGDGQAAVPPGTYTIQIHVNPPYAPDAAGNCPLAKDAATGLCHQFAESNYANNIGRATVSIPSHPGRDGYGPLKGQKDPTPEDELKKGS